MKAGTLVVALTMTAAASMTGCSTAQVMAEFQPLLQRATAIAIGGNAVAPEQIKISDDPDVHGGSAIIHWHASAPNGEFDCSATRAVTYTVCVKK
jgi:hypothetical protein